MNPTSQQQAIIDAALDRKRVVVQALAGTGKTSTLEMVATAIAEHYPDLRIQYIAFNKSIVAEAKKRMPSNVVSQTANGIGYYYTRDTAGLPMQFEYLKDRQLAEAIGYFDHFRDHTDDLVITPRDELLRLVRKTMTLWCQSSDPAVTTRNVPKLGDGYTQTKGALERIYHRIAAQVKVTGGNDNAQDRAGLDAVDDYMGRLSQEVVRLTQQWWDNVTNPHVSAACATYDHQVKLWALSNPQFDTPTWGDQEPFDLVLLDEAQDTNSVLAGVIDQQRVPTMVVGDSNQAIYGWRGAKDYLRKAPRDIELPLTASWRFGPEVAEVANAYLRLLGSSYEVEGSGASGRVGEVQSPDAVVVRSNIGMLSEVFRLQEKDGSRIGAPASLRLELMQQASAVGWLRGMWEKGDSLGFSKKWLPVPEALVGFETWNEAVDAAEDGDDPDLSLLVRVFERFDPQLVLQMAAGMVSSDARSKAQGRDYDTVVVTAHKSKGSEWDSVRIGSDFKGPRYDPSGELVMPSDEELRIAYVAVTRARRELDPGPLSWALAQDGVTTLWAA